jgi:hypothetical protein
MGSVVILRARTDQVGNAQSEFDFATGETVQRFQAVILDEDFVGPGHTFPTSANVGYPWIKKTVQTGGSPSVAVVSNAAGGVAQLALDSTGEKQEASLYRNGHRREPGSSGDFLLYQKGGRRPVDRKGKEIRGWLAQS